MIKEITHDYSTGVSNELIATTKQESDYLNKVESSHSPDEYVDMKHAPSCGSSQFSQLLKQLPKTPLKILDVGVGGGQSTIYLASLGHNVSCIEPSATFCNVIETAAKKFLLNINIYRGVAEDMINIEDGDFDIIFFNASFHHVDEPLQCLANAYTLLKDGGYIMLASESFLRFYNSKKHWQYLLENYPDRIGHYGGNEHVYYNWEYCDFLKKSNFKNVRCEPTAFMYSPVEHIENILNVGVVRGQFAILSRFLFYMTTAFLFRNRTVFNFFSKISLVGCNFVANK
ncbi:bifunctional 2-polyprenyl-6-hydroxyphenol methylase/3-demethylubiquinol 3-O-methyltransferase UbiG [Mucilaginibacter sp.]|uniref:class I SAM-dependent methyltransferase n=1 Tax=Mucilaginibacter sp. TaxID=1882438 RepID=UPI00263A33E7|nr:class I SAM-dependent methyltransferase [Mucilaginibacter sp.]MDB4926295.1 SAM-dependent methyltransferase [Mucilaginibacter sp.]